MNPFVCWGNSIENGHHGTVCAKHRRVSESACPWHNENSRGENSSGNDGQNSKHEQNCDISSPSLELGYIVNECSKKTHCPTRRCGGFLKVYIIRTYDRAKRILLRGRGPRQSGDPNGRVLSVSRWLLHADALPQRCHPGN